MMRLRLSCGSWARSLMVMAVAAVWLAVGGFTQLPAEDAGSFPRPMSTWPGAELFTNGPILRLRIDISSENVDRLRNESREFIPATVSDGNSTFTNVAVHLKGSVGSFRPVDEKPAWTLDFSRFNPSQRFHGLRRIHLNNSVEDPSYCSEWLGATMFRLAGVPAARVAHAVVTLNGRRLGPYVLIEGFTEDFLSCYFRGIGGDLFEPGEGHDINQRLKRVSVQGLKTDRSALDALARVVADDHSPERWRNLETLLDTDRFLAFMTLEVMLCHRDGYCLARNNFRLYVDAERGKVVFFPHGMDQLLGSADLPWQPSWSGLVAKSVMDTPEGKQRYRACFGLLFTNAFASRAWSTEVDRLCGNLRTALSENEFADLTRAAGMLKERLDARRLSLQKQLLEPELKLADFTANTVYSLESWTPVEDHSGAKLDQNSSPDGTRSLHVATAAETSASWRSTALLPRGHYRFEGKVRVAGVKPLPSGEHQGAGLRVGGQPRPMVDLVGTSAWRPLVAEFEVKEGHREVQLVCELRAESGEAWFDLSSLRVVRLP